MSEETKDGPQPPPLKDITKQHFQKQIEAAKQNILNNQKQITKLQELIQQDIGVIGYADHILKTFKLPDEPKKPELEVK